MKLLGVRRFSALYWTQFWGAFNDNLFKNALIILVTFKSAAVLGLSPAQMVPFAGGVFILPFFLFSATAGQIADKFEKARVIRWVKLLEIAIMLVGGIGFLTSQIELLMIVLFLMGLQSTFFGPLKYSILPQLLTEDELVEGNALVEAGTFLAILLGTLAGGVLITLPHGAPWVSFAVFVIACLGWWSSRKVPVSAPADPGIEIRWNPVSETRAILQFARSKRAVFLSVLGISWFWFFGAGVLSLIPPYCKDVLSSSEGVVTLFLAVFSIGIAVGSMLCERLSRGRLELGLVPWGSLGISVFAGDLFLVGVPEMADASRLMEVRDFLRTAHGPRILFDLFMLSVFSGLFTVPLYTMMQERSDPAVRSRVIAANNVLNALFMVVASLLLMALMQAGLSIPAMFLVLAVLNAVVAFYIYSLLPEFAVRFVMGIVAHLMYRLKVRGLENIPRVGPAVLVCNHVSFVDWLVIGAGVGRPVRFIMDYNYAKGALTRWALRQAKVILIAPANENMAMLKGAFAEAARALRDGEVICIFPEGAITRDGKMRAFGPGVEKILQETAVPVVPMALNGLWGSIFSRKDGPALSKLPRRFWFRVELRIGHAVPASGASRVSAAELRQKVEELLS